MTTTTYSRAAIQLLFCCEPSPAPTARGVLLHIAQRLHTAMRYSGAEMSAKGRISNSLPALHNLI